MKDSKSVTLTGCISRGTEPNSYRLTNVTDDSMAEHHGTGTGTTGTGTSPMKDEVKDSWTLSGAGSVDLSKHVGHRVQVTGMATGDMKDKTGTSMRTETKTEGETTSATGTETTEKTMKGDMTVGGKHKLNVQSIKMISETCTM